MISSFGSYETLHARHPYHRSDSMRAVVVELCLCFACHRRCRQFVCVCVCEGDGDGEGDGEDDGEDDGEYNGEIHGDGERGCEGGCELV